MSKLYIFDLDGVIVDTAKYHFLGWSFIAEKLGTNLSPLDNEQLKGLSRIDSIEKLLEIKGISLDEDEKIRLAELKNNYYIELIQGLSPSDILPGVIDLIRLLRDNDMKTALGSSSKNAIFIIEKLQIADYFDVVIDGNDVSKAKPDPEVFLLSARKLSIEPSECVVLEDSASGIEAAINGGMKSIGVGSTSILSKANIVVASLEELNFKKLSSNGLI